MEKITYRKTLDVHKNGIQFTLQGFETADNMSRVIEISLMASGDTVDIPLEGVVAMMYVITPSAKEPSINYCLVRGNTVVYEVQPITEEGMTEMQLKLIQSDINGATKVLISPRFAVEVMGSNADDGDAEQTTTFTALENAVAKAEAVYSKRIDRIDVSPDGIFKVYYADGVVYESDAFLKLLLSENTDIDLNSLISEGIASFTAEEVAEYLDDRYRDIFAKAEYSADLFADTDEPTFVKWDSDTENTPYKAGLTTAELGFALVFGSKQANHTVISWTVGNDVKCSFNHRFIMANDIGWDSYITTSGGTMTGPLGLGGGKGSVSADEEGTFLKASDNSDNAREVKVSRPSTDLAEAVKFFNTVGGEKSEFNLFGEHNLELLAELGFPKIEIDSYKGDGTFGDGVPYPKTYNTITSKKGIKPMFVFVTGGRKCAFFLRGADTNYAVSIQTSGGGSVFETIWDDESVAWHCKSHFNGSGSGLGSVEFQLNESDETYTYIIFGF